jgi:hypothetical protein
MKALWNTTFELFRRHIVLWVPCSIAGILMLWLGKLERAEIRWLVRLFATQHSVLGGEVPSADFAQVQHRAMMVTHPSAFLKYLIEVSLFVVALAATKEQLAFTSGIGQAGLDEASGISRQTIRSCQGHGANHGC